MCIRDRYRREDIGFVFQFYNLVPNLTALENVELALQICKNPLDAKTVLSEVGLKDRLGNFPAQLSGGEQQRVSIARADVYKRQISRRPLPVYPDGFPKEVLDEFTRRTGREVICNKPYSGTDVYKRQIYRGIERNGLPQSNGVH